MLKRIVSGGQTGADIGALRAAAALGLATGGMLPKGCLTERGPAPWLKTRYGLIESPDAGYTHRTITNLRAADATLLLGDFTSPGSRVVMKHFERGGYSASKLLVNPTSPGALATWVIQQGITILNVAGNRESGNRGIEAYTFWLITRAFGGDHIPAPIDPYPTLRTFGK